MSIAYRVTRNMIIDALYQLADVWEGAAAQGKTFSRDGVSLYAQSADTLRAHAKQLENGGTPAVIGLRKGEDRAGWSILVGGRCSAKTALTSIEYIMDRRFSTVARPAAAVGTTGLQSSGS